MSLLVLAAGGTFDKHYDEIGGTLGFDRTHLPEVLARCRITVPLRLQVLPLMDSLDMQDVDRERLAAACRDASERRIVIVHGTDTMQQSAQAIAGSVDGKTVILTGAMRPYELRDSDALFNFGCAVMAAQLLNEGVHLAMNGQVFAWNAVHKNRAAGRFEAGA